MVRFQSGSGGTGGTTPVGTVHWDNVTGKPTIPTNDYNDLTNKPVIPTNDYNDLDNLPVIPSNDYNDLDNLPEIPTNDYNDLINKTEELTTTGRFMEEVIHRSCLAWYKIEPGLNSVDLDPGTQSIDRLLDVTHNQKHLTNLTSVKPQLMTDDGISWARFSGSNRLTAAIDMRKPAATLPADWNTFVTIVFRFNTNVEGTMWSRDNGGWDKFIQRWTADNVYRIGGVTTGGGKAFITEGMAINQIHCITVGWYGDGTDNSVVYMDGVKVRSFTQNTNTSGTETVTVGSNREGLLYWPFVGDLFEMMIGDQIVTDDTIAWIHRDIRRRYNLEASWPQVVVI